MTAVHADRTALLVMDMQPALLAQCADAGGLVERINGLVDTARAAGSLVVFVRVGFRPGYPELAAGSPLAPMATSLGMLDTNPGADVDPRLHRVDGDVVVTKHRTSALHGNDLGLLLRSRSVETLILSGFSTAGVVLSTLDSAFDDDYRIVVASDCCADPDPDLHDMLLAKLFPRKATVVPAAGLHWAAAA